MIRMGMIGCGAMARSHVQALEPLRHRMRFTAFADIDLHQAQEVASFTPDAVAVSDYRRILDGVDAVIVAVPHDLHHAIGLDCLRAKTHLLMEKPLAVTEEQCRELIAADTSPDPVFMLGYVMRHDSMWAQMGEYIRNRTYGDVFQVSIWTEQYTDISRGAWYGQAKRLGGGQLFSHGCHYIDLLLHWLGDPAYGSHVGTNLGTPWMEREGTSNVCLRFQNGALAYHFGTWGARGSRLRYSVHAHCTKGMLELDRAAGTITLHRDESGGDPPSPEALAVDSEVLRSPERVVVYRQPGGARKALLEQMEAFLDCIEMKRKPEISAQASLRSLQVIWRLYEAEEQGLVADLRDL